ncbi:hypothetical protein D9M68_916340 [compost metagenome]
MAIENGGQAPHCRRGPGQDAAHVLIPDPQSQMFDRIVPAGLDLPRQQGDAPVLEPQQFTKTVSSDRHLWLRLGQA